MTIKELKKKINGLDGDIEVKGLFYGYSIELVIIQNGVPIELGKVKLVN